MNMYFDQELFASLALVEQFFLTHANNEKNTIVFANAIIKFFFFTRIAKYLNC